ncbi:MAG: CHRD domain-containing protein, partial [Nitrosarchaeum sp.]
SGTIIVSNSGGTGILNNNFGILTNSGTITVSNSGGTGIYNSDGTLTNNGTINKECDATYFGFAPTGNPINNILCNILATINGANEVDPTPSTATGFATFSYNDATNELTYDISFGGLSSAETGAHIHEGAVGLDGPIIFTLPAASPKTGTVTLSDSQETSLLSDELYVNIHSTNFPGGEIRGQIVSIDTCTPSVDWIINSSCILVDNFAAPSNVLVQNNSILVIPSGVTLDIDFLNHNLTVKSGSGVWVKSGGKIF